MRIRSLVFACAVLLALTGNADSATISGLGDPLTDAALTGGTQQGFDAVASGLYNSLTLGNVTYVGVDAPFTIGPDYNGDFNTTGGQSIFNDFDLTPQVFRFDFGSPVNAFGFNWGAADNSWTLRAYDSSDTLLETYVIPGTFFSNAGEYFGIAATGISYATLSDNLNNIASGDYVFIDRFTISDQEVNVPEPAMLSLLGLGIVAGARARRQRRVKA